eukprot:TRINITY_DN353_c0_g2_i2.p1 TRINITY_DN353_c0_g2~~TRINITY_DN353_c0_g2_i2.p1  ORF type:complete len:1795 (+),score=609.34 TRINITY_DN353_c0_g2_i2:290-5674(+)
MKNPAIFLLVLLFSSLSLVSADPECRGGSLNWATSTETADYNLVTFTVYNTWRASSFNAAPTLGLQLQTSLVFQFGDGNSVAFTGLTITSLDLFQDSVSTTWNATYRYSVTSFPTTFNAYLIFGSRSTQGLKNNAGKPGSIGTNVVITKKVESSPILQSLSVFKIAATSTLRVQLFGVSTSAVTFSKATTALQLGGPLAVTGKVDYTIPTQFSISSSGLLTFDASALTLSSVGYYQMQVLATDAKGYSVALDLLVQVYAAGTCNLCLTAPLLTGASCVSDSNCCGKGSCNIAPANPVFIAPTPLNGATFRIPAFYPWTFELSANDTLNANPATIYASSLPPSATLNIVSLSGIRESKYNFLWVPPFAGSYQICFGVRQTFGFTLLGKTPSVESSEGQRCFGVTVYNPPCGRGYVNNSLSQCVDKELIDQALCCLCPSASGLDPVTGCAFCLLGSWGLGCQGCNDCGDHGTCSSGKIGTGTCTCDDGWYGVSPPLSTNKDCRIPRSRTCTKDQAGFVASADYQLGTTINPQKASLFVNSYSSSATVLPIRVTRPLISNFDLVFLQDVSASTTSIDLTNLKIAAGTFFLTKGIIGTNTRITFGSFSGSASSVKIFGPLTSNLDTIGGTNGYLSQMAINFTSTESYVSSYEAVAAAASSDLGWGTDTYKAIFVLTRKGANPNGLTFDALTPFLVERSAQPAFLFQGTGILETVTSILRTPYHTDVFAAGFGYSAFLNPLQALWSVNAVLGLTFLQQQFFLAAARDPYNFFRSEKNAWLGLLLNPVLTAEYNARFQWNSSIAEGSIGQQNIVLSVLGYGVIPVTIDVNRAPTSSNLVYRVPYGGSVIFKIPSQDADQNVLQVNYLSSVSGGSAITPKGSVANGLTTSDFNGAFNGGSFSGSAVFSFSVTDGCLTSAPYTATFIVAAGPTTVAPTTLEPTTLAPTTTLEPTTTETPTTTVEPTTEAPTTTLEPTTTETPTTTVEPTTEAPTTTLEPTTTEAPTTTVEPTTETPTTDAPTTVEPTTQEPTTTAEPTTQDPYDDDTTEPPTEEVTTEVATTTEAPTTEAPTSTAQPTTEAATTTATPTTTAAPTTTETPTTTAQPTTEAATTTAAPTTVVHYPPIGSDSNVAGLVGSPVSLKSFLENVTFAYPSQDDILLVFTVPPQSGLIVDSQGNLVQYGVDYSKKDQYDFNFNAFEAGLYEIQYQYHSDFNLTSPVYSMFLNITNPPVEGKPPKVSDTPVSVNMDETAEFFINVSDEVYDNSELIITIESSFVGQLCLDKELTNCLYQGSSFPYSKLYYRPPAKAYGQNFTSIAFSARNPSGFTSETANATVSVNYVNAPPVAAFPLYWNVFQNSFGTFSLSGTDDHTPANEILFTVNTVPTKGNLSYVSSSSGNFLVETAPLNLPFGGNVLRYSPPENFFGANFTSFQVTLTDGDGKSSTYLIYINVIHVNQPPTISGDDKIASIYVQQNLTIGFRGYDIDSPFLTAVLSNKPNTVTVHECIYDNETKTCTAGEVLKADKNGVTIVPQIPGLMNEWYVVLVPIPGIITKQNYATLSFYLYDDYGARSGLYISQAVINRVNQSPELTLGGPYVAETDQQIPLHNNTFVDPDGGPTPMNLLITALDVNVTLGMNSTAAFQSTKTKVTPDCVQVSNLVINCTAPQEALRNYLASLVFKSPSVGNFSVRVTVDDMGAGSGRNNLVSNNVTGEVFVEVKQATVPAEGKRDLTLAIGLGSAGGALGAAGAVALVAKLVARPPVEAFSGMMDFSTDGINSNPLYVPDGNEGINPIYDSNSGYFN